MVFSDLLATTTWQQVRATLVATLVQLGVPADQWRAGGALSSMLTAIAMVYALLISQLIGILKGLFLGYATGVPLRFLATYFYGITVPQATFASGPVTLTNTAGGQYTQAVGTYIIQNPATGATYANTVAFVLNPLATLTGITFQAQAAGSVANSQAGAITAQVTNLRGVMPSNPGAFIGIDAPGDAQITQLCYNSLGVRSVRGPRTAYAYAVQTAISPTTGAPVNVNRWAITSSSRTSSVALFVAAPSGTPTADDLQGVANNVEALVRPPGVSVTTSAATVVSYVANFTFYVFAPTALSAAQISTSINQAILAFFASFPIGGITASSNTQTNFRGVLGGSVSAAVSAALAPLGVQVVSQQGGIDLPLVDGQVAAPVTTAATIILPQQAGVVTPTGQGVT